MANESVNDEARTWAVASHLASLSAVLIPFGHVLGPLAVWLMKRKEHPFVDHHGKEALNFQLSMTVYAVVGGVFAFFLFTGARHMGQMFLPFLFFGTLFVLDLLYILWAAWKTSNDAYYTYPITIRFVS